MIVLSKIILSMSERLGCCHDALEIEWYLSIRPPWNRGSKLPWFGYNYLRPRQKLWHWLAAFLVEPRDQVNCALLYSLEGCN